MPQTETDTGDVLLACFEGAAAEARRVEDAFRREAATRIDELADERATAFRRLNLVRTIAAVIRQAEDPAQAAPRARIAVANALGWDEIGPRQEAVLDRLKPVFAAVQASLGGEDGASVQDALTAFENWYRTETGSGFYALFERYMPETPRVDF